MMTLEQIAEIIEDAPTELLRGDVPPTGGLMNLMDAAGLHWEQLVVTELERRKKTIHTAPVPQFSKGQRVMLVAGPPLKIAGPVYGVTQYPVPVVVDHIHLNPDQCFVFTVLANGPEPLRVSTKCLEVVPK